MRIRKRPAAPPAPPSGSVHVSISDDIQESHLTSRKASTTMQYHEPAAVKPLKSLHLTTQTSNSSNGDHKYPSISNARQPLLDRLQHPNGASYSASANSRTAVCDNNHPITQIPQYIHVLGLTTERRSSPTCFGSNLYGLNISNRNSPASASPVSPVRVSSSATQRAGSANYHERNSNRAEAVLRSSTLSPDQDMPELIIVQANSTKTDINSLQENDMEKLPLQVPVAQPRKRSKTAASSSNLRESKLRLQDRSSVNKEAARIVIKPQIQFADVSVKKDSSMNIENQLLAKPNICTRKSKRWKKKMKSRNMLKNQQRTVTVASNDEVSETLGSTVRQCNRQDGRRWRCKQPAVPGHLYCEYHSAKMSKSFRLKLLQQQTQEDQRKKEQSTLHQRQELSSTLQHNQEQSTAPQHKLTDCNDNRHILCAQLDLNIPINVEGSSSITTTDDQLQLNVLDNFQINDCHKGPKLNIDQQEVSKYISAEEPTHDTVQLQHKYPILNSKPIHELSINRTGPASSIGLEASNTIDKIKLDKYQSSVNCVVRKKPGNSIRGRWRKKCKPLLRKLNEIQDVVTTVPPPIRNSSDVNDDTGHVCEDIGSDNVTQNPLNPFKESELEPMQAVIGASMEYFAERTGTYQSSTDIEDDEIRDKGTEPNTKQDLTETLSLSSTANCTSGTDLCRNNYKITLTSCTSDGGLSSSYVISQIHLNAFTKILQAAAAESVQNVHVGDIITDAVEKQRLKTNLYGNCASAASPARTEKIEALPECVLNSDPREWRSDMFY